MNAGVEDGESQEATDAYAAKRVLFDKHSAILRILHDITKMTLGADSQKFKDLGIVPSSEIWTPGQPEPGEPEASGIFHYRATPYNAAMEPGIASEDTVEVT
ncbi:hypothetical protein KAH81_09870 [bacterium]|nr:hypothetical protein [bacterium]